MKNEYVLQYKYNRKWKDAAWAGKSKVEAVRERDLRNKVNGNTVIYRAIERTTTETVVD
jgi:hypothetical protein